MPVSNVAGSLPIPRGWPMPKTGVMLGNKKGGARDLKRVLFPLMIILVLTACTAPVKEEPAEGLRTVSEETYRIGADDRLQISVWRNPELSVAVPVRPDGMISVPLIGDVKAGGKAPEQVAKEIQARLASFIRDPNVTVILTDLRSHEFLSRVRVTGAVRAPRSMPFRQGMTVLDAVLEAGGVNDFAAPNRSKLYRKSKDKSEVIDIDLGNILHKGKLGTNERLIPGDVITVPERLF